MLPDHCIVSTTTRLQFQDVARLFSWARSTCKDNDTCIRPPAQVSFALISPPAQHGVEVHGMLDLRLPERLHLHWGKEL